MPSIKKAVYGIFRQLSSNSVAPTVNGSNNGGHIANDNDETSADEIIIRNTLVSNSTTAVVSTTINAYKTPAAYETDCSGQCSNPKFQVTDIARENYNFYVSSTAPPEGQSVNEGVITDKVDSSDKKTTANKALKRRTSGSKNSSSLNGEKILYWETGRMAESFIHTYLSGRLKKPNQPEIYYGKTGVDLPVFQIVPLDPTVFTSYTGPDGGLSQVPCVTRRPLANIANLDDELNLSYDADLDALSALTSTGIFPSPQAIRRVIAVDNGTAPHRTQSLNCNGEHEQIPVAYETKLDWSQWHDRAYGLSTSLYECHPFTQVHAGTPIADVFAICARRNSCVLALADGVNWGEKSRLAARCAIRGAVEHLDDALYSNEKPVRNTLDIFHALLGAFHTGHQLILQETGALTTLCVVVVAPLKGDSQWVVCACNVGDSLAFVFSDKYGVREVTLGSHDIQQMRDMRDAGGALGPVDGVNPELHNMTCSMTTVDPGDIVFITSDGVSDNFDPVVGKFCVIRGDNASKQQPGAQKPKQTTQTGRENGQVDAAPASVKAPPSNSKLSETNRSNKEKLTDSVEQTNGTRAESHLPVVEAYQRHELMLLRMEDLLRHGVTLGDPGTRTARDLCENLINFATQLTMAKRKILEDPELYQGENRLAQRDQRLRRRLVRQRISEMPGKLDHATVVAYTVGEGVSAVNGLASEDEIRESSQDSPRTPSTVREQSGSGNEGTPQRSVEESATIETNEWTDSASNNKALERHPDLTPTNEFPPSLSNTPTSPVATFHTSDSAVSPPPLPSEPLPSSSSSDEEDWTETISTVRGPFEPNIGQLLEADGSPVDGDWATRVKMIDESSVSSLSGTTPVPPQFDDDEGLAEYQFNLGMDDEDLATPAQESLPPWPADCEQNQHEDDAAAMAVEAPKDQQDVVLEQPNGGHLTDKLGGGTSCDVSEATSAAEADTLTGNTSLDTQADLSDSRTEPLPLLPDECRNVNVNVHVNSPEDVSHAFGSISISSVLECCDLIIRDTDLENQDGTAAADTESTRDQDTLGPLDEEDVFDIFTAHGVPVAARRWPPPVNRKNASKCVSLPLGSSPSPASSIYGNKVDSYAETESVSALSTARRSQRSLMNESYYMATTTEETPTATSASAFERGSKTGGSGRFGKLSRAFDRLERAVVRRKHRRGSPTRHTVATDGTQWAEMKEKTDNAPPQSNRISSREKQTDPTPATASPSKLHGPASVHLSWSPVRAFRALKSPKRQSTAASNTSQTTPSPQPISDKKPAGLLKATPTSSARSSVERKPEIHTRQLKVNIVDTTADVIVENTAPKETVVEESVTFVIPHSASDTEIVRISANSHAPTDHGRESDV